MSIVLVGGLRMLLMEKKQTHHGAPLTTHIPPNGKPWRIYTFLISGIRLTDYRTSSARNATLVDTS